MKSYRPRGFRSEKISVKISTKKRIVSRNRRKSSVYQSRISKSASTIKVKDNFFLTRGNTPVNRKKLRSVNSASSLKNSYINDKLVSGLTCRTLALGPIL